MTEQYLVDWISDCLDCDGLEVENEGQQWIKGEVKNIAQQIDNIRKEYEKHFPKKYQKSHRIEPSILPLMLSIHNIMQKKKNCTQGMTNHYLKNILPEILNFYHWSAYRGVIHVTYENAVKMTNDNNLPPEIQKMISKLKADNYEKYFICLFPFGTVCHAFAFFPGQHDINKEDIKLPWIKKYRWRKLTENEQVIDIQKEILKSNNSYII